MLSGCIAVRFVAPSPDDVFASKRWSPLGPPRFGTQTVFVVTSSRPFEAFAVLDSTTAVDAYEVDMLLPLTTPMTRCSSTPITPTLPPRFWTLAVIDSGFLVDQPNMINVWDRDNAMTVSVGSGEWL
jgi:hypothetical protein